MAAAEQQFDLGAVAEEIDRAIERLSEHRDDVSRTARGVVGSQAGHALGAKARKLSVAITDLEKGVLSLKDAAGLVPAWRDLPPTVPSPGQPVHGGFEIIVRDASTIPAGLGERLTVWPEKPISALLNEALVLLSLQQEGGTYGLRLVGMGPVHALTVNEANISAGDVLEVFRPGAAG